MRHRSSRAGFSLVEGLVALAVLMTIVIGLIPLFTQSMVNNTAGRHMTQATNFSTDTLEGIMQLPLNNELLTLADGLPRSVRVQLISGREALDSSYEPRPGFEYAVLETRNLGDVTLSDDPETAIVEAGFADADALRSGKWLRIIEVEQFQISSLSDGLATTVDSQLEDDERIVGGSTESNVQLKKIQIQIVPRGLNSGLSLGQGSLPATLVKSI